MPKKKQPRQQTLEATLGQPRLRDTVAKRAAARSSGGSSPSVQKSSPRHNAPPSSVPTAFSFTQNQSSPLKPIRQNVVVIDLTSEEEVEADSPAKVNADEEGHYELSNGSSRPRIVGPESLRSGGAFRPGDQPLRRAVRSPLKRQVVESDSDEDDLPLLSTESKKATENVPIKTDDQSEDDDDVFSPRKTRKAKHNEPTNTDHKPLVAPILTNRLKRAVELDSSDEDIVQEPLSSPTKRRRLVRRGGASSPVNEDTDEDHGLTTRPPPSSAARRKPRTEKEKARELLRRKRAGEVIDEEEESSEEEDKKPLYDSDPDHEVLCEFLDDDEGVLEIPEPEPKDKSPVKKSPKKKGRTIESGSDSDVNTEANSSGDEKSGDVESGDDWLVEDDHIGVPDEVMNQIPLEFTGHSHKPLKDHFRDVIEWYVLRRINPGFVEKWNKLYRIGFDKLDEQVIGLARSKFSSAVWKPDFNMALRARPEFTGGQVGAMENNFGTENCSACGRSGHPAKYQIRFEGAPYYTDFYHKSFLEDVKPRTSAEDDSNEGDNGDSGEAEDDHDYSDEARDEKGMKIPPESKAWLIGSVCYSNAEDAHKLMHWKHELMSWVDANLEQGGYMTPKKVKKRRKWEQGRKDKLVDKILKKWIEEGVMRQLFKKHKDDIDKAHNKNTSARFLR